MKWLAVVCLLLLAGCDMCEGMTDEQRAAWGNDVATQGQAIGQGMQQAETARMNANRDAYAAQTQDAEIDQLKRRVDQLERER